MITEDQLEQQCLGWFREVGWETVFGPDVAHDGTVPERANYREVVLVGRLTRALARLNPGVPAAVLTKRCSVCSSSTIPSPNSATACSSPDSR